MFFFESCSSPAMAFSRWCMRLAAASWASTALLSSDSKVFDKFATRSLSALSLSPSFLIFKEVLFSKLLCSSNFSSSSFFLASKASSSSFKAFLSLLRSFVRLATSSDSEAALFFQCFSSCSSSSSFLDRAAWASLLAFASLLSFSSSVSSSEVASFFSASRAFSSLWILLFKPSASLLKSSCIDFSVLFAFSSTDANSLFRSASLSLAAATAFSNLSFKLAFSSLSSFSTLDSFSS
mmetsp:Transcript_82795/g.173335  ORF Transcript_82795/g.173335 Transcript_82795/m.173335 type:complete len:237 (+) Transcript_82795:1710-2420(+)